MKFKEMHHQDHPLLLANVWDVPSAKIAEELGFQAIGTSSSAIATLLGYSDGEEISFSEVTYMVKRISACTNLPLSVDLEAGYSRDPLKIVDHIKTLAAVGVIGINIEDSCMNEDRTLVDAEQFAALLNSVVRTLKKQDIDIFVNVRTDTFLLNISDKLEETKCRIARYQNAGAHGIFIPCIEDVGDIEAVVQCSQLPINVMCMPNLPSFDVLSDLGVARISMGNFIFEDMYRYFKTKTSNIQSLASFKPIF